MMTSGIVHNHVPSQAGHSPLATYKHIYETSQKRVATFEYLQKVHEGQVHYFSTISYNLTHLSNLPSLQATKLGRRATNYLLLGTSLTPLLEFYANNPLDYLRALAALLAEFDTYTQLSETSTSNSFGKRGMGMMFKTGMSMGMRSGHNKRRTTMSSSSNGTEGLISELNENAASVSSLNNISQSGSGSSSISGLASIADSMPMPPVSTIGHEFHFLQTPNLPFDPDFGTSFATLIDILIEAYAGLMSLITGPEACVAGVAEAFAKTDKQMKKVMFGGIVNEFGDNTRKETKNEVAGLNKLVLSGLM